MEPDSTLPQLAEVTGAREPDDSARQAKARLRAQMFDDAPDRIGRYEIQSKLGLGAMGVVYLARDPVLQREVAIKVLLPGSVTAEASERFRREAQALARLTHPNVVQVYEVGTHDDERFIGMEYVAGGTLSDWLVEADRSVEDVLDIFEALGYGLQAAHDAGVIHRDFKPRNVLMGEDRRPRITDFGLAAGKANPEVSTAPDGVADSLTGTLTRAGTVVGTPAYMSPEQLSGDPLDHRSDQFAYCIALFEALYGARPFVARSLTDLTEKVMSGELKRPRGASVPARIDRVVARGLAVDRANRHRSMRALLHSLRLARRSRLRRVRPFLVAGGVAATLAVALALNPGRRCEPTPAVVARSWDADQREAVQAGLAASGMSAPDERAAWVRGRVDHFFDAWSKVRDEVCVAARDAPDELTLDDAFACLRDQQADADVALRMLRSGHKKEVDGGLVAVGQLGVPAECQRADAMRPRPSAAVAEEVQVLREDLARAISLSRIRDYALARPAAEEIVQRAEEIGYEPLLGEALLLKARLIDEKSARFEGEPLMARAYELGAAAGDQDLAFRAAVALACLVGVEGRRPEEASDWLRTARSLAAELPEKAWRADACEERVRRVQQQLPRAIELGRAAVAGAEAELGVDHVLVALARVTLASELAMFDQAQEAETELERAMDVLLPAFGPDHPMLVDAYFTRARILDHEGDPEGALQAMRKSVEVDAGRRDGLTLARADRLQAYGAALAQAGHYRDATEQLELVLRFYDDALDPDDLRASVVLGNLARAYAYLGELDRARAYGERALVMAEARVGGEAGVATSLSLLADILHNGGEYEDAVAHARRALAIEGYPAGRRMALMLTMAVSLDALGNTQEAADVLTDAVERSRERFGSHPQTAALLANLGWMHIVLGRPEVADELLQEALAIAEKAHGPEHYEVSRVTHIMVRSASDLGRVGEAVELARRTLKLREHAAQDPGELASAYFSLAEALRRSGAPPAEATEHAQAARKIYANTDAGDDLAEVEAWLNAGE